MIKYTLMLLGSVIIRFLPVQFAYSSAKVLGRIAYWFFKDMRKTTEKNLSVVLGEEIGDSERQKLVKNLFTHLALNTVDFLRFPYATYPKRLVDVEGTDLLADLYRQGKGVILVSPHLGNWEVGGMLLTEFGFSVSVVTESIRPERTRFNEDTIANLYRKWRERVGMKTIPLDRNWIRELRALRRGELLVLLADRDVSGFGIDVEFFGMRSRVPRGPAVLALRTGAAIITGMCVRGCDGRLHVLLEPLRYDSEDVDEVTRLLVKKMEGYIRRYPDQWFVFQPPWS